MSGPFKRSRPRNLTRSPRKRRRRNLMRSPRNLLKSILSDYDEEDEDEDGRPEMRTLLHLKSPLLLHDFFTDTKLNSVFCSLIIHSS